MLGNDSGTVHRLLLDRILGDGAHMFIGSSESPKQRHQVRYRCGCVANEDREDRFRVVPCGDHRDELSPVRV